MRNRALWGGAMFTLVALGVAPFLGEPLPDDELRHYVLTQIRLPRVLMGFVCGAALSVAGVVLQAILKNPLATPFTLGVASGASFGVVLAIVLGLDAAVSVLVGRPLVGMAGAVGVIAIAYRAARVRGRLPAHTLLLAGVALTFLFSSLILAVQYTASPDDAVRILRWLVGSLETGVGFGPPLVVAAVTALGIAALWPLGRAFNVMSTGEEAALGVGVDVDKVVRRGYFVSSLMVGAVVAFAGPHRVCRAGRPARAAPAGGRRQPALDPGRRTRRRRIPRHLRRRDHPLEPPVPGRRPDAVAGRSVLPGAAPHSQEPVAENRPVSSQALIDDWSHSAPIPTGRFWEAHRTAGIDRRGCYLGPMWLLTFLSKLDWLPPLLLRGVLGAVFFFHGMDKVHPGGVWDFGESYVASTSGHDVVLYVTLWTEFLMGFALLLGVLTRWGATLLFAVVAWDVFYEQAGKSFLDREFGVLALGALFVLAIVGPGSLSLDRLFFGRRALAS